MKKTLSILMVIICATICCSKAQIVIGNVGNGYFTDWSGYTSQMYGLDFNNDGNLEFALSEGEAEFSTTNCMMQWSWSENGNNVWTNGSVAAGGWDEVHAITQGTSIGASANWEGQGDAYLINYYGEVLVPVNQEFYLGFRVKLGSNVHYGWAKVKVTGNSSSGYNAQWMQIAYNSQPNASINAGATGVGIVTYNNINVQIYPNPTTSYLMLSTDMNVEVADIYDINGKLCLRANVSNGRIDVSRLQAGNYFIQVSDGTNLGVQKFVKK